MEPSFRSGETDSNSTLGQKASFILFQTDPNPFQYSTDIKYSIPSEINQAEILVTDINGRVVKRIDVHLRDAEGIITIYSSDLNNGVYTYSLIGDGRVLESKRMVCAK